MKAFVPSAGKRKRKMKTFRTVVFRLFKTWQWVMTRRDDETLCYAAGFTVPCRHIETVRGISTCSPHCRNSPTEICSFTEKCLKKFRMELEVLGLPQQGKGTQWGHLTQCRERYWNIRKRKGKRLQGRSRCWWVSNIQRDICSKGHENVRRIVVFQ